MKRTIFRDRKTGRFVTKARWRRGINAGSKRYKRERIRIPKAPRKPPPPPPARPQEWLVVFTYKSTSKVIDYMVIAFTSMQAINFVYTYLRDEGGPSGNKLLQGLEQEEKWDIQAIQLDPPAYHSQTKLGNVEER